MTIPAPTVFHFRLEPDAVSSQAYPSHDAIFDDLAAAYRKAVKAFYDAGCRYLQFDDTAWAYLCSPAEMKSAKARGINTDRVIDDYATLIKQIDQPTSPPTWSSRHACLPRQFPFVHGSRKADMKPVAERLLG